MMRGSINSIVSTSVDNYTSNCIPEFESNLNQIDINNQSKLETKKVRKSFFPTLASLASTSTFTSHSHVSSSASWSTIQSKCGVKNDKKSPVEKFDKRVSEIIQQARRILAAIKHKDYDERVDKGYIAVSKDWQKQHEKLKEILLQVKTLTSELNDVNNLTQPERQLVLAMKTLQGSLQEIELACQWKSKVLLRKNSQPEGIDKNESQKAIKEANLAIKTASKNFVTCGKDYKNGKLTKTQYLLKCNQGIINAHDASIRAITTISEKISIKKEGDQSSVQLNNEIFEAVTSGAKWRVKETLLSELSENKQVTDRETVWRKPWHETKASRYINYTLITALKAKFVNRFTRKSKERMGKEHYERDYLGTDDKKNNHYIGQLHHFSNLKRPDLKENSTLRQAYQKAMDEILEASEAYVKNRSYWLCSKYNDKTDFKETVDQAVNTFVETMRKDNKPKTNYKTYARQLFDYAATTSAATCNRKPWSASTIGFFNVRNIDNILVSKSLNLNDITVKNTNTNTNVEGDTTTPNVTYC